VRAAVVSDAAVSGAAAEVVVPGVAVPEAVLEATVVPDTVAAPLLDLVVTEPLGEPYLVPEAVSIPGQATAASGARYYGDDAERTTAIDLTAYDETTEFSVRQLRAEETTARSA
jgi:hypothetical protein